MPTALLLLLGCTVALILAEATVRLLDPHVRDHVLPGRFLAMDTALGWRQRADQTVTHRTRYFETIYTTNSLGYRDVERAAARVPGRTRVLVFGDSQVFGWGIPYGRRFTDLAEARRPGLEVWNLGVMGYGLDQQLLVYERQGAAWQPDVVVLFAAWSTLQRAETGYIYRKHKPRFVVRGPDSLQLVPPAGRTTGFRDFVYRALSPLHLPYFLERRLPAGLGGGRTAAAPIPRSAPEWEPSPLARALLTRAARVARARAHRLLVLASMPPAALEAVRRLGGEHGFDVAAVELPGPLREHILGPGDAHWNARAHERIAESLGRALADIVAPGGGVRDGYRASQ